MERLGDGVEVDGMFERCNIEFRPHGGADDSMMPEERCPAGGTKKCGVKELMTGE